MENPTGKGTAFLAKRGLIRKGMTESFIYLLQHYRKAFYAIPYKLQNGNMLYHVKVPSEKYKENKIQYDVFFELTYESGKRLAHQYIQMFSNCPSFIFSYCYAYNTKSLIIDRMKRYLPNQALTQPPSVRNPDLQLGFEKSTWIAASYLIQGGCLTDQYLSKFMTTISPEKETEIFNHLVDFDTIMAVYQKAAWEARRYHRKERSPTVKEKQRDAEVRFERKKKENKVKRFGILGRAPRSNIKPNKLNKKIK